MTTLPKITVVTPSFNQGRYLRQCIESVLEQGYPNLEYIIIDGGSTDDSASIIESYSDALDYWVSEKDLGQSNGINKGLRRATGDLVAWLNSDDLYVPGALNTIAEAYGKDPTASFYYGNGYRGSETGEPTAEFYEGGTCVFDRDALAHGLNYILQPSVFMNREIMIQVDLINEDRHYGMDTDLWLKLSKIAPPQPLIECLSISREYEQTKTSMGGFGRAEELRQIAKEHTGLELTPGALLYYLHTIYSYIESQPNVYPPEYLTSVTQFWQTSALLLHQFQAAPNGTPYSTVEAPIDTDSADAAQRLAEFSKKLHAQRVNTPEFVDLTTQAAALNQSYADLSQRFNELSQNHETLNLTNTEVNQSFELLNQSFQATSQHAERLEQERLTLMQLNEHVEKALAESEKDRQARLDKLVEADTLLHARDAQVNELEERVELLQSALLESKLERESLVAKIDEVTGSLPGRLHKLLSGKKG